MTGAMPRLLLPRLLLPWLAALVACDPPPKEAIMEYSSPAPAAADTQAEAEGRRTLSNAFVRVGPDGHVTVALRDGRTIVLRDLVMRPREYCGVRAVHRLPAPPILLRSSPGRFRREIDAARRLQPLNPSPRRRPARSRDARF